MAYLLTNYFCVDGNTSQHHVRTAPRARSSCGTANRSATAGLSDHRYLLQRSMLAVWTAGMEVLSLVLACISISININFNFVPLDATWMVFL